MNLNAIYNDNRLKNLEKYDELLYKQLVYLQEETTFDERKLIELYTGESNSMNCLLRTGRISKFYHEPETVKTNCDLLFNLFERMPQVDTPITVYRGLDSENYKNQDYYADKGFISTSLDFTVSQRFYKDNGCIMKITINPGSKILPIYKLSAIQNEKEILLNPNGIFKITGSEINSQNIKILYVSYSQTNYKVNTPTQDRNKIKNGCVQVLLLNLRNLKHKSGDFQEEKIMRQLTEKWNLSDYEQEIILNEFHNKINEQ